MRALTFDRFGPLDVLRFADRDEPRPARDEVVVAVAATSVNVIDLRVRKGLMGPLVRKVFPKVPGADVAGLVVELGEGVAGLKVGDAVFGAVNPFKGGAFAERVAVPASQLAVKPAGLSFAQAATLPIAGIAALTAMRELARVQPGDRVLIHGGSGAVGLFAIQIAKRGGAHVTAVAGKNGQDAMLAAGADACLDYRLPLGRALDGPFAAVLNASGAMPFAKAAPMLTPKGRLVEPSPSIPVFLGATLANVVRRRQHLMLRAMPGRESLQEIGAWAAAGALSCPIARVFDFSEAIEATATMERGGVVGKVVVTLGGA